MAAFNKIRRWADFYYDFIVISISLRSKFLCHFIAARPRWRSGWISATTPHTYCLTIICGARTARLFLLPPIPAAIGMVLKLQHFLAISSPSIRIILAHLRCAIFPANQRKASACALLHAARHWHFHPDSIFAQLAELSSPMPLRAPPYRSAPYFADTLYGHGFAWARRFRHTAREFHYQLPIRHASAHSPGVSFDTDYSARYLIRHVVFISHFTTISFIDSIAAAATSTSYAPKSTGHGPSFFKSADALFIFILFAAFDIGFSFAATAETAEI